MTKLGRWVARRGYVVVLIAVVASTAYAAWLHLWPRADVATCDGQPSVQVCGETPQRDDVRVEIPTRGLPHKGARIDDAGVTMIECSDFQCPFSRRAAGTIDELLAKNDDLAFFHTHFPLEPMHAHAGLMARASVAAQQQGKFWQMHDALFATPIDSEAGAIALARRIDLDPARFSSDLQDPAIHREVDRQRRLCRDAGVRGVPTFFVNGRRVVGSLPLDQLQRVIDDERTRP
ncbi:MAG TPA: DsbA family protein [Nannocystaceae bacterium]|nr:DsbA family protein [Nannocystaceae bacterium]